MTSHEVRVFHRLLVRREILLLQHLKFYDVPYHNIFLLPWEIIIIFLIISLLQNIYLHKVYKQKLRHCLIIYRIYYYNFLKQITDKIVEVAEILWLFIKKEKFINAL
jgi:hypothetical protein